MICRGRLTPTAGNNWTRRVHLAVTAAALQLAAVLAVASPAWASTTELAASSPAGLQQSTANLYWTSNAQPASGEYQASVWRASKDNQPGEETLLYQQTSSSPVDFGALQWAEVKGQYYAYFVANYPTTGVSKIERVSLTGGQAVTLAKSPAYIGGDDLVTDGSHLFWADAKGVRKLAIGGGSVKTLARGTTFGQVALDDANVYYSSVTTGADGASEGVLNRVAKTGGPPSVVLTQPDATITALATLALPDYTEYYVGFATGLVEEGTTLSGVTDVLQTGAPTEAITSISYDAASGDILWGETSYLVDYVVSFQDGTTSSVGTLVPPVDVQGDGTAMYWGDEHLEKAPL